MNRHAHWYVSPTCCIASLWVFSFGSMSIDFAFFLEPGPETEDAQAVDAHGPESALASSDESQEKVKKDNEKNKKKKKKKKKKQKKEKTEKHAKEKKDDEADLMLGAFQETKEKILAASPEENVYLEFYAGTGKAAARACSKYGFLGIAIDYLADPAWDLHAPGALLYLQEKIRHPQTKGGHLGTECRSWSSARHGAAG